MLPQLFNVAVQGIGTIPSATLRDVTDEAIVKIMAHISMNLLTNYFNHGRYQSRLSAGENGRRFGNGLIAVN